MNSFFIPHLGTQIYAMAGMQTKVHLIANEPGDFFGISANYSGHGFSKMGFAVHATDRRRLPGLAAEGEGVADRAGRCRAAGAWRPTATTAKSTRSLTTRRCRAACSSRCSTNTRMDRTTKATKTASMIRQRPPSRSPCALRRQLMLGKLTLEAVPYHEPIIMGALAAPA